MKKRVITTVVLVTFLAVIVISYYIRLNNKTVDNIEAAVDNSEVGQILAVNLNLNYPGNPRDVVMFYSRIIKSFYDLEYTDDQLVGLAQHARDLFDSELLLNNDYEPYMDRLKAEIASYQLNNKKITDYVIERASDIEMFIDNGRQYARAEAVYYTRAGSAEHNKVSEVYTLRQDDEGRWKILFWETNDKK